MTLTMMMTLGVNTLHRKCDPSLWPPPEHAGQRPRSQGTPTMNTYDDSDAEEIDDSM